MCLAHGFAVTFVDMYWQNEWPVDFLFHISIIFILYS